MLRTDGLAVGGTSVVGDFNADGRPDIVSALAGTPGELLVQLVGPGGVPAPVGHLSVSGFPGALDTGYIDHDRHLDVCVATQSPDSVVIFLGDGSGQFSMSSVTPLPGRPLSIELADFDGDENLDVVTSNSAGGPNGILEPIPVLLGDGAGGLALAPAFLGGDVPLYVASIKLAGDEIPDIAVSDFNAGLVSLFHGNGDGTFVPGQVVPVGTQARWLAVADIDGDGLEDLVVTVGSTIRTLFGTMVGDLVPGPNVGSSTIPGLLTGIEFTGLNSDQAPDLVFAGFAGPFTCINVGDGTFEEPVLVPGVVGLGLITAADFDVDGHTDLAYSLNGLTILPSDRHGGFIVGQLLMTGGVSESGPDGFATGEHKPNKVIAGDFDNDGVSDVIVVNTGLFFGPLPDAVYENNGLALYLGSSGGGLSYQSSLEPGDARTMDVLVEDLNDDGYLDVLVLGINTHLDIDVVRVFLNDGSGSFAFIDEHLYEFNRTRHFAIFDADNDTIPDLVVLDQATLPYTGYKMRTRFGVGDGTFEDSATEVVSLVEDQMATWFPAYVMGVADINSDSNLDLYLASGSHTLRTSLGNGDGSFLPPAVVSGSPTGAVGGVLRDTNGDEMLDLMTSSLAGQTDQLVVRLGEPGGSFAAPITSIVATSTEQWIVVGDGDVDQDGCLDLLLGGQMGGGLLDVVLGAGDGTFAPADPGGVMMGAYPTAAQTPAHFTGQALGDFDGDGDLDIACTWSQVLANEAEDLNNDGVDDVPMVSFIFPGWLNVFYNQL
ncbi:MAG: hypothetical protein ACI8QZ_003045 [Chlamydiales bacterium]|jgi:hypothetical protein